MSMSIQLPDLPTLTRTFNLRVNKSCRTATLASEASFQLGPTLSKAERAILPSAKIGLLSGLCFPTCDPPQLEFLTNFTTLLVFAHERLLSSRSAEESGWATDTTMSRSGIEILNEHELFKSLTPKLTAFCARASPTWHARFSQSTLAYRHAQLSALGKPPPQTPFLGNNDNDVLESYISLRRDTSGARIIFDLVEIALGHNLKSLEDIDTDTNTVVVDTTAKIVLLHALDTLRDLAAEIVALSSDIVSYSQFQSTRSANLNAPHNAIVVCMHSKNLSPQGAMNTVMKLLKDRIRSFRDIEHSLEILRGGSQRQSDETISVIEERSAGSSAFSWLMDSLKSFAKSVAGQTGASDKYLTPLIESLASLRPSAALSRLIEDLDAYLYVLRDYISGNVHWFYETELYFGTKGEEVKAFGWVFLNPQVSTSVEPDN